MSKKNRFNKKAGLFDTPLVGGPNNSLEKKDKPLKKWDEIMTKRYIAIEEVRKEINYFASDFENWARDQFGIDSDQFVQAKKLSKKLEKTETLLYNIMSMMTELSKTGELNNEKIRAFNNTLKKFAETAMSVKADCLPGCTCPEGSVCPEDEGCDNCKPCVSARDMGKESQDMGCSMCGAQNEVIEAEQDCSCKEEDDCPNSYNCRYCPSCQEKIVAEVDSVADYDMSYTVSSGPNGVTWSANISGSGFSSMEEAEQDLLDKLSEAVERMDLEEEDNLDQLDENSQSENLELEEPEETEKEEVESSAFPAQEKAVHEPYNGNDIKAQRQMSEGSPRGAWVNVMFQNEISDNKIKALEVAFEEKGIFTQSIQEENSKYLRVYNSEKNIEQVINEVLKEHNVKGDFASRSGE